MTTYLIVREMRKLLGSLNTLLDKGVAHATGKKFDVGVLLEARLAPDMFPLIRQIQICCDQAKFAASRGAGKESPAHPDNEKTLDDLRARISKVVEYLDGFQASDFAGIEDRTISLPRWEGKSMRAIDYVIENAMPNFFFHLTTAYLILRHNGVEIGKLDYLGALPFRQA